MNFWYWNYTKKIF